MIQGPDREPYVDVWGFRRSRNRVELEGVCVVLLNEGKTLRGRLNNIRYKQAILSTGIGTELITAAARVIYTGLSRLVKAS